MTEPRSATQEAPPEATQDDDDVVEAAEARRAEADVAGTGRGEASEASTTAEPAAATAAAEPPGGAAPSSAPAKPMNGGQAALFDEAAAADLQQRWQAIQVQFVDEPRGAVEQADRLVDDVLRQLTESFKRERGELEQAWSGGDEASTEDLRQAIRRYRSFFNRLLAV